MNTNSKMAEEAVQYKDASLPASTIKEASEKVHITATQLRTENPHDFKKMPSASKVQGNNDGEESRQFLMCEYYTAVFSHMDQLLGLIEKKNTELQTNNVLLRTIIVLLCALFVVLIYFAFCGIQLRESPQDDYKQKYATDYNDYGYNNPFSNSVSPVDTLKNYTKKTLFYVSEFVSKFSTPNNWSTTYDCSHWFSAVSLGNITFYQETVLRNLGRPLATFLNRTKMKNISIKVNATA